MRTYRILKEKAQAFDADPEVRELIADIRNPAIDGLLGAYSADNATSIKALEIDADTIGARGLRWERLDQILMEHLFGAR